MADSQQMRSLENIHDISPANDRSRTIVTYATARAFLGHQERCRIYNIRARKWVEIEGTSNEFQDNANGHAQILRL